MWPDIACFFQPSQWIKIHAAHCLLLLSPYMWVWSKSSWGLTASVAHLREIPVEEILKQQNWISVCFDQSWVTVVGTKCQHYIQYSRAAVHLFPLLFIHSSWSGTLSANASSEIFGSHEVGSPLAALLGRLHMEMLEWGWLDALISKQHRGCPNPTKDFQFT